MEEVKRFGDLLRGKRKELNLSLKEVENATSIRSAYIDAIEEGKIHQYISGIYAQGFMKQYATFLGFNIDQMIQENPEIFQVLGEKHDFAYGIGTLEARGSMGGGVKWWPSLLWAGASAVILVAAWFLARFLGLF
jgi:transcriptional regulator with XRE-family HTH domain